MKSFRQLLFVGFAAVTLTQAACTKTQLQGTYVLERRELPDGTIVQPPNIAGCLTYSDKFRNFNVYWKDASGQPVSISYLARYRFCKDRYTEHSVYHLTNNWPEGTGATYDLSQPAASSYVHKWGDQFEFNFPLYDEPHVVVDPCGLTATKEGAFTDHWIRVK